MPGLISGTPNGLSTHRAQAVDATRSESGIRQFLAPDAGLEVLPRHHRGRGFHQRLQDLQRGRAEPAAACPAAALPAVSRLYSEVGDVEHARQRASAPARQRVQPHLDFLQRERLDQGSRRRPNRSPASLFSSVSRAVSISTGVSLCVRRCAACGRPRARPCRQWLRSSTIASKSFTTASAG